MDQILIQEKMIPCNKSMELLSKSQITVHRLDIRPFGNGLEFHADITATYNGWKWHWKCHRTNSSSAAMGELQNDQSINGLVRLLQREDHEEKQRAAQRAREQEHNET